MALPDFTPDIDILYLLPYDKERAAVVTALAGFDYDYVYRVTGPAGDETRGRLCIWQLETHIAPHITRARLEERGFQVTEIVPESEGPFYVRFAWEYAPDTDWPAAPYYPRPADWPIWPWERAPRMPRTDAVAGPAGVVLCDLEQTPAARIPVPGVPGLDYTYDDMGMVDAAPAIAPILDTIHYRQRVLPVAEIVRTETGSVYARVDISTTQRPMWHCIPIARMVSRAERKAA